MGCILAPMSLELPVRGLRVAIFGSTEFHGTDSRHLCEALGQGLARRCGAELVLLTGGNAVVHEVLARSFLEASRGDLVALEAFLERFWAVRGSKRLISKAFGCSKGGLKLRPWAEKLGSSTSRPGAALFSKSLAS